MSLADEIINGTYKKRDIKVNTNNKEQVAPVKSVADKIIDGTYKTRDITIPTKKYTTPTTGNKFKYIGKSFGTGVHQGTAGIAQGLLTDSANEMQKGRTKDTMTLLNNLVNAYAGNDLHYIGQSALDTINEGINIINDKDKNLWQKAVDLNLDVIGNGAKALMPGMGIYSAVNQLAGKYSDTDKQLLEWNEKLEKPIEEKRQELAKESEQYDGLTNFVAGASQSIGNMVPSIAATAITKNPNVGLAAMGMSVKGQATQEALSKGMDIDKATQIGDAKALIEVATEKLSGGAKIFGKGSLDDIAEDLVKKGAKSKFGRFLLTQVANTGGEILEEEISNVLGNAIDKGTTDPDRKIIDGKEALETMGSTAFTTTMLNLLTGGMINDYNQISNDMNQYRDITTGEVLNENSQDALHEAENLINQNQPTAPINTFNQQQNNVGQNENIEYNQRQVDAPTNVQNLLNNEISTAIQNRTSKGKVSLGRVSNNVVNSVKSLLGIDVTNRTHVLADNDIRHMLNEHGDPKVEAKRGQIAITEDDIQKIPDIVDNYDDIVKGNPNRNGDTIRYIKNFEDGTTYLVEVVPETSKTLNIKTMWKKPTSLANQLEPSLTSETQSRSISSTSNNIIPQNNNNMQAQNKSFEDAVFDAMDNYEDDAETQSPLQDRNINTIGKQTKTNAYQYDNPKVKPYFQEMAQMIGEDLGYISSSDNRSTQKGGGTRLSGTTKAIDILHNEQGYSYNQIAQGLQNIINDNGQENNAISKKIELIIDEQLRNGYTNALGQGIAPNQEYINTITENEQVIPKNTQNQPIPPINNTQGETVNWNEIEKPEGKIRKHYKSIIESSNTTAEAKKIARELIGSDTYVPESNKSQIQRADKFIEKYGTEKALDRLMTNVDNNTVAFDGVFRKVGVDDIALGERLIQYYSKTGDAAQLQNAILATAQAGTDAGRAVQLLSIINHQTPQGQVTWIQRSVDKMNQELINKRGENAPQFEFTPEMMQKIMETNTQEEMYKALDEVYEELGQQVSKSRLEQIDSWRYFSMLANPKTHIRNIVGNVAMGKLQSVKNKVAGAIEGTVAQFNPNMERTHTLKPASKEVKQFAKDDIVNVADSLELNQDKYNPKSRLENSMRTFKSDAMENTLGKAFELNEKALEVEDAWGLKSGYVKALSEYMTANNLNPKTITDAQLAKARNYAIAEAKEATFHSENAIAVAINQFSKKGKSAKFLTDAVLPFVKTPMNVAKAGMEYNPTGLIKTLTYDIVQLRKGNISVNKYIDNLSKGLTGTGVAVLGYAMAEAGILKASGGDDDKKEKFDEALGRQAYSLEINGKTYSLDWLAPAGIPLFVGAEAHNINKAGENEKTSKSTDDDKKSKQIKDSLENWANAMTNSMSPMAEMSMISGLTSALKSYDQDSTKMLGTMGTNAVKSYVNQFIPTALGQVARTADEYERSTTSTAKGILPKAIDQTKLQMMSKIPGLREKLPIKTDVWGKEQKQEGNVVEKAVKNAILPFNIKSISNSKVDKALNELYGKTGSVSILPTTSLDKTFKIDGQTYRMTNEEYNKYRKNYGQNSYKLLDDLVSSSSYKGLNDEQKQKAIESVYSYAKEKNKVDYAENNKIKVKPSTLYKTMEDIKSKGGNQSSYLHYISKTENMTKQNDKIKVLTDAKYSDKEKTSIYENCLKSKDKEDTISTYETMKKAGLNINEWLKYEQQEFESDKKDDGTITGKSVSGSKKQKVYNYVNSANMNYNQRLLLLGTQYKLSNAERKTLVNYVNSMKADYSTRMKIFSKIKGVTVYKNGTIKY